MNQVSEIIDIVSESPLFEQDVYDCVRDITIEDISSLLDDMIVSADTFDGWVLNKKDGNRLVKILNSKKRIIKSSFKFQIIKNFSDFKSKPKTRFDQNLDRDRYSLKLAGVDSIIERQELESIVGRFEEIYRDFYYLVIQRLQLCIQRSHVSSTENPLHVKRLYEAFRYSLDNLNLESKFQIALYRLFADFVVTKLSSTYEKIDSILIKNNILPDLQSLEQQQNKLEFTPEVKPSGIAINNVPELSGDLSEQTITEISVEQFSKVEAHYLEYLAHVEKNNNQQNAEGACEESLKATEKSKTQNPQEETNKAAIASSLVKPRSPDLAAMSPQPITGEKSSPQIVEDVNPAANIRKGDWFEIVQGTSSKMAKLVWKAEDCSLLIFVDNTGARIRDINGYQFNTELELGSIRLVTDSSVTSNNTHFSVIQRFMGILIPWSTR